MLEFGTGGLRGVMGEGDDQINVKTIQRATQGLASYILKNGNPKAGVIIGFDSRHNSDLFAKETARVLSGNGITTYLFKEIRPTPFISFACRAKKCTAAVMITASHNPKEYNGYKVYWADGGQIVPPHDTGIMNETKQVKEILFGDKITYIGDELDAAYLKAISSQKLFSTHNSPLKIVYSSLHGTGITLMPKALREWGFSNIHLVREQIVPDGDFPTVKFPNPEFPETLRMGIQVMQDKSCDILIVTDPDADRVRIACMHENQPYLFNGNEIAALIAYFLLKGKIPSNGAIVSTIVTTRLLKAICTHFKVAYFDVLTGFKYIGEKIHLWENGTHQFLFGAEESYGYLLGTASRDKDGIITGCFLSQMAHKMKSEGKTLVHLLEEIYKTFGFYCEIQQSIEMPSPAMDKLMQKLRQDPPTELAGFKVTSSTDFLKKTDLPPSDVLLYQLEGNRELIIRPSGTEPKIKIYARLHTPQFSSLTSDTASSQQSLSNLISTLESDLKKS